MSLLGKLKNNTSLLRGLWGFAVGDRAERASRLTAVREWTVAKEVIEATSFDDPPFKGIAHAILQMPGVKDHLRGTPHLGILSELAPRNASRALYVTRQAELLLELKQVNTGVSLGKALGSVEGRPTGLVIAQSWAILFSYGHLWGTHATERAVLFELRRNPTHRRAFLAGFGSSKTLAEKMLHSSDIYTLSQLLALRRLVALPEDPLVKNSIAILRSWVEDEPELRRVKAAFKVARRLAYLQVQSMLGLEPLLRSTLISDAVSRVSEHGAMGFVSEELEDSPFGALFERVDEFHFRTFFTSPAASARVLSHLREFKTWWTQRGRSVAALDDLFRRPGDWPVREPMQDLFAVFRFDLPVPFSAWKREVEYWWQGGATWGADANFLITYTPGASRLQCDVYAGRRLRPLELHHMLVQFARYRSLQHLTGLQREALGRAVAKVIVYVLESILALGFKVAVRPLQAGSEVRFATVGHSKDAVSHRIAGVASDLGFDSVRGRELQCCSEFIDSLDLPSESLLVVQIGLLVVLDSDGRDVAEIDGLVLESSPQRLLVHILEIKSSSLAGSKKQLNRVLELLGRSQTPLQDHKFSGALGRSATVVVTD